ncbi:MAG: helix-turn-helix transcriptional regulator [Chloroflexota bacterium]|nr:helix-turn-helix transcriptional regulator [Chloroflexota bacterium]
MPTPNLEKAIAAAVVRRHQTLATDILRLRDDAGVTRAQLACASGVDLRYLARIEKGTEAPSMETYQRLASALGADLHARMYPNTGPAIRDRHQAQMLEVLLAPLHPRWTPFTELAVRRPSRGWIDLGLHDAAARVFLATELQSELRRIEQLVRWSTEKAASLPSWDGWPHLGDEPVVSRLLVIRRTRATREIVSTFERQLRVAYPAHPQDALASLAGMAPWPGPSLLWIVLVGKRSRIVAER